MTNEQINIAIAEACGWNPPPEAMGNMTHGGGKFLSSEEWRKAHIPHYCNDLNAMHEAEKKLTKKQLQTYLDFLTDAPRECVYQTWTSSVFATAHQRAEAFLKTIEKWKEQN